MTGWLPRPGRRTGHPQRPMRGRIRARSLGAATPSARLAPEQGHALPERARTLERPDHPPLRQPTDEPVPRARLGRSGRLPRARPPQPWHHVPAVPRKPPMSLALFLRAGHWGQPPACMHRAIVAGRLHSVHVAEPCACRSLASSFRPRRTHPRPGISSVAPRSHAAYVLRRKLSFPTRDRSLSNPSQHPFEDQVVNWVERVPVHESCETVRIEDRCLA